MTTDNTDEDPTEGFVTTSTQTGDGIETADDRGFTYGGADGARLGTSEDAHGGRWSPITTGATGWRINGRTVIVTDIEITYETISVSVRAPFHLVRQWREAFRHAGDVEMTAGAFGEFRTESRASDSLEIRLAPPSAFSPDPLRSEIPSYVSGYDETPIGGGHEFDVTFDLTRANNAGESVRSIPEPVGLPPIGPEDPRGWGVQGWGHGGWGHPYEDAYTSTDEAETEDAVYSVVESDGTGTSTEDAGDAQTVGSHRETTGAGEALSTTVALTQGSYGDQSETVARPTAEYDSAGNYTTEHLGPLASSVASIERPYGHFPGEDRARRENEWAFTVSEGDIFVEGRHVRPIRDAGETVRSVELSVVLDSEEAGKWIRSISHLDAIYEVGVPDGNNRIADGTRGRNCTTLRAPSSSPIPNGVYAVLDWSLSPTRVTEWECEVSLAYLWPVDAIPDYAETVVFGLSAAGRGDLSVGIEIEDARNPYGYGVYGEGVYGVTDPAWQ